MRNSRSFRYYGLVLIAALGAQLAPVSAQTHGPTMDDALAAIRAYAPQALREQGAPGMSVAITDRTHTLAIITTGVADLASKSPVTAETRFPIGSISKSMTSLALLQLHDRGLVDLNARVEQYLPSWSIQSTGGPVLVHELLSHTGGVPDDYSFAPYGYAMAALRDAHTLFPPGTSWSYSNDGYATAGAIVARVGRQSWQDAVQQHVFDAIGMTHSSPVFTNRTLADAATPYQFRDGDLVATPPDSPLIPVPAIDFVDPAGSVISTPEDMARYIRFYLNGGKTADGVQLLKPATFDAMTTADRLANGKPAGAANPELAEWPEFYTEYGYGLAIFHTDGDHLIGHTGGVSGYTACMQANLTRGFGVIAMSNLIEAPLHPCAIVKYAMAVLRAQSLGQPLPQPPSGPPIPPPTVVTSDYTGTYRTIDGTNVNVTGDGDKLTLHDGSSAYRLVAQDHDLFWTDDPRLTLYYVAFERNAAKMVDGFTNGGALYVNDRHTGPTTFTYPAAWDRLTGHYETSVYGTSAGMRVVVVNGVLTIDGVQRLKPLPDGSFTSGGARIRFDTPFEGKMQRVWLDGADFYRVELP